MHVTVEMIGIAGLAEREFEVDFAGGTIEDLVNHLADVPEARGALSEEKHRRLMESVLVIVNGEILSGKEKVAAELKEADRVTLALPMAGG
ncbi:MAG: MoaD/ThiS family protein [Phycisphaerae bacterium]|nr:MoaD/ThiS family protein [Phycisphaerae bacterium]